MALRHFVRDFRGCRIGLVGKYEVGRIFEFPSEMDEPKQIDKIQYLIAFNLYFIVIEERDDKEIQNYPRKPYWDIQFYVIYRGYQDRNVCQK